MTKEEQAEWASERRRVAGSLILFAMTAAGLMLLLSTVVVYATDAVQRSHEAVVQFSNQAQAFKAVFPQLP